MTTQGRSQLGVRAATEISSAGHANRLPSKRPSPALSALLVGGEEEQPRALRIAILDRDSGFLVVLAKRLERPGWRHEVLSSRISAKALAAIEADVLVLDLAVLGSRRWTWLGRLCEQRPDLRVIVCTGASTAAERVRALRLGADDWLSKPCHPEELLARIEAITHHRRRAEARDFTPVTLGEVEIRPDQYQAFVRGVSVCLTRREYQLIVLLARAGGEVLPRERIYESLWGYEMARNDRSVDVFVHKLRRKLERASPGWRYVHTHFAIGYRLAAEATEAAAVHDLHVGAPPAEDLLAA
jgi:DNA-binding response OmpR family regulator